MVDKVKDLISNGIVDDYVVSGNDVIVEIFCIEFCFLLGFYLSISE